MTKEGSTFDGLGSYLIQRFNQYGVPTAFMGAGLAGLAHLVSLYKENKRKEEEQQEKPNELVVEVPVPKRANDPNSWRMYADVPAGIGFTLGGLGLGYAVVDHILKQKRKDILNKKLEETKKEYSNYLGQELSPAKNASECPTLDGLILAAVEAVKSVPVEDNRKQAALNVIKNNKEAQSLRDPSMGTIGTSLVIGLPFVSALLAGHHLYYNRQKDIQRALEKEEADKMKRAPQNIKIVSKPVEQKTPSVDENPYMLLEKEAIMEEAAAMAASRLLNQLIDKESLTDEQKEDGVVSRKEDVVDDKDLQKVDDNTYVLLTEGGNTQIDALDPEALKILEQHKDKILKSFALGMNVEK